MSDTTLVIKIDWGLGRNIAMTWPITAIAKQIPVKVIASRPLAFWWNPYIKSIHWLNDRALYENVIRGNDYIELEPYTNPKFFNDWENWLKIVSEQLWLKEIWEPCLFLAEHEKLSNKLDWEYPILFQPFGSSMWIEGADKSYRSIKIEDAQYIADKLIEKWFTIYVIEREDQPKLNWCIALTTWDLRWVISLANRYPVLWIDSCIHHAAKAFNKRAIVIWSWTDAWRFWYDTSINLRGTDESLYSYVPFRLGVDFNTDIINQYTNIYTQEFLDEVVDITAEEFKDKFYL